MVIPGSPPYQKFPTEKDSPTVHTPRKKRAEPIIESDQEAEATPSHVGKAGLETGSEEPITRVPQRLPDSPFPKKLSPKPYQRPGTPYRKVNLPYRDTGPDTKETEILDKTDDSFEIDSESERTLTEEPKETPKRKIAEMPEGITKRKLAPVILPFGPGPEKGPKSPEKSPIKPAPAAPVQVVKPPVVVPVVRFPTGSPVRTPPALPPSPVSPLLIGSVAMGTVEEIKNALIESNRVAAMPIPQFYGKKGEKPEDHIMKVEDYFQNYNITNQEQNVIGLGTCVVVRPGLGYPL